MLKFESWKETQKIENGGNVWTIFAYSNLVDLHPTGFDASRIATSDTDMREALIKAVTPQGKAQVYPIYPKQSVSISLNNSSVLLEPGAMLLTRGNVTMTLENPASGGSSVGGFFKRAVTSVASGESMIKPKFTGTGDVLLEPTKNFLFLIAIQESTFICDQGLWKACDGNLEKVKSCIKLTGYVNSMDTFIDQPKVINGASDIIAKIFDKKGEHTRAAVSVNSLPLGVAVEVDGIFELN